MCVCLNDKGRVNQSVEMATTSTAFFLFREMNRLLEMVGVMRLYTQTSQFSKMTCRL